MVLQAKGAEEAKAKAEDELSRVRRPNAKGGKFMGGVVHEEEEDKKVRSPCVRTVSLSG